MYKMQGVIPPMITPFDKDGNIDFGQLEKLVEYLSTRVDGVFICGSYGSGPLMSVDERKQVAEKVIEVAKGRLQIIVMTGCANTKDTIELTIHAKEIGADAASVVAPFYFHHNPSDVVAHYTDVVNAVPGYPIYVYVNPKFSGYKVEDASLKELKQVGIHGIKDGTFDIMQYAIYMRELADDNFDVALGTEAMWLAAEAYGCEAFIPGLANAYPEICSEMYKASVDGDRKRAKELQFEINKLRDIMYLAKSTQMAIYAFLELRGVIKCYPRKPFNPATQEEKDSIKRELKKIGML